MLLSLVTTLLIANCVSEKLNDTPDLLTHPRITETCGQQFNGKEGSQIRGFKLQQVFIATTSGLQTLQISNSQSSSIGQSFQSSFCNLKDFKNAENLKNFLETLKIKEKFQGKVARSDFKIFNSLQDTDNCPNQSLSWFGVSQMINLGKFLLQSYYGKIKSLGILQHQGLATTFGDEALFHSLHALLFGLLTEKQFIYTDIKKASSDFSQVLGLNDLYKDLHYFVEHSFVKENFLFKDTRISSTGRSNSIGMLFGSSVSAKDIISYLSNSVCHTFLDPSIETIKLSYEAVSSIFNESDLYNKYLTASPLFQNYSMNRTFSLRQLVKAWLFPSRLHNEQSSSNNDLRAITVDDLFMICFLTALNIPVTKHVTPSTRLIIESFTSQSPVFHSSDPTSRQPQFNIPSTSLEYETNILANKPNESLPGNQSPNQFTTLSKHKDLKHSVVFTSQDESTNLEQTVREILNLPPSLTMRMSREENREKKNPDQQTPLLYVRVLYNGEIITSAIPGCGDDPIISLGVCSFGIFEAILDRIQWQNNLVRDEL